MENKYSTEEYKKIKDKEREELKDTLNQGIKNALNSERYKNFLNIMSRCHNYSFTNSLLISLQTNMVTTNIVESITLKYLFFDIIIPPEFIRFFTCYYFKIW